MCRFSFLMCTYNSEKTVDTAIQSCLRQTYKDWELLVLDNASMDACCETVERYADGDSRIKLFKSERNVGWPKGTSLLLEKAEGDYMCFLAADDYLVSSYALEYVSYVIDREDEPPLVLVRHENTTLDDPIIDGKKEPVDYITINSDRPVFKLSWAMDNWYYNSLFHFLNIDFLKKENVDFYDPFYGDNDGMTKLLVDADRFCGIYNSIYALTSDTSQTIGAVVAKEYVSMDRWGIIKDAAVRYGDFDVSEMIGIADYIIKLGYDQLYKLCQGSPVRDLCMNNRDLSLYEKYRMIQKTLAEPEMHEMTAFCGPKNRVSVLFDHLAKMCKETLNTDGDVFSEDDWLYNLVSGLYDLTGEPVRKKVYSADDARSVVIGLISEGNPYCYGFTEVNDVLSYLHEETLMQICRVYGEGQMMIAEGLKTMADQIRKMPDFREQAANSIMDVCMHISKKVEGFI